MSLGVNVKRGGLIDRVASRFTAPELSARSSLPLPFDTWANYFNYQGLWYQIGGQTLGSKTEEITGGYESVARQAYKSDGVVFACSMARLAVFSEARFQFRRLRNGRPGDLFGTPALRPLERPWTNGTTGDLLARMIQDVDCAGNSYTTHGAADTLRRLRPDWVTIVLGSQRDPETAAWQADAEVIGYLYHPGGRHSGQDAEVFLPQEIAHFMPIPDPIARFRGMTWIEPVVREIMGDQAMTEHKLKFVEQGATVNMAITLDLDLEEFNEFVRDFREAHEGVANAYKTLFLMAGAKPVPIGANMQQLDFKVVQGAGETRIAAAAGTPPVIVGLSEGLQGSSLNEGNYQAARRRFADATMRPLWRNAAGSLATLINVPSDGELWYDARDIAFLREDAKDGAEIQQINAITVRQLVDAGFTPESVIAAVTNEDFTLLVHTNLFSVQLQPPGTTGPDPSANGAGNPQDAQAALPAK